MNAYKKLHNKWHIKLKKFFHNLQGDIPYCEVCNSSTPPIDMAHSRKRRDIHTEEEYMHAAMLCRAHHNEYEWQGPEKMFKLISDVIDSR